MAPEHEYFFWLKNLEGYPNLDRSLAVEIFRQGRIYEQDKQYEVKERPSNRGREFTRGSR